MRPEVVADLRGLSAELDVEGVAKRVRGVGAHDDGLVAGGRAAHIGCRGDRCLTYTTLASEEDYPHGRSLRSGCSWPSELDASTCPSGASRHLPQSRGEEL